MIVSLGILYLSYLNTGLATTMSLLKNVREQFTSELLTLGLVLLPLLFLAEIRPRTRTIALFVIRNKIRVLIPKIVTNEHNVNQGTDLRTGI